MLPWRTDWEYSVKSFTINVISFQEDGIVTGFLSTGDEHSPGNFGLKDQTLALRWVKNNIRAFGGDDEQVTIFGVSAGASSVHMHMMSPLSQGKLIYNMGIFAL